MKAKLIISGNKGILEQWTNLPFVPRTTEWFNLQDILNHDEIDKISTTSNEEKITKGQVKTIEYRHDDNDFFVEIYVGV